MDTLKTSNRAKNPYEDCNVFIRLSHWYLNKTFQNGYKRQLDGSDVFKIAHDDCATVLSERLSSLWKSELGRAKTKGKKPSYFRTVLSLGRRSLLMCVIGYLIIECAKISQTLFLKKTLDVLSEDRREDRKEAYYWAAAMIGALILQWCTQHPFFLIGELVGVNIKSATLSLVYQKSLRINQAKLAEISTGHVITMFASDAQKLQDGLKLSPYIISGPLSSLICVGILWDNLGASSLAGLAVVLLLVPLQSWFGKMFAKLRAKALKLTDRRINSMNEIISSMQVTKMFTWEESFFQKVKDARKAETRQIRKAAVIKAINSAFFSCAPYVTSFATFTAYYYLDEKAEITVGKVYFALSIFYLLRLSLVIFVPVSVQMGMEFYISCKRIEKFLQLPEMNELKSSAENCKKSTEVCFQNATASWEGVSAVPIIKELSFRANKKNNLLIFHGPVGSGKTSILMAAMNEMNVISGNINVQGSISYAAQQPWIFSGTIRQNILFGKEYEEEWFNRVVEACGLQPDLEMFKKREFTLVGERGVSLSGGQKARIGLARAVYSDSDILLLDDPFSAVDTKVGKYIFNRCIKGLLKDKVIVLVTHQTQYLKEATESIHLKANEKTLAGSLNDLEKIDLEEKSEYKENKNEEENNVVENYEEKSIKETSTTKQHNEEADNEEVRKSGKVSYKVYVSYFLKGVGIVSTISLFFAVIFTQAALTFTDYWIGEWARNEQDITDHSNTTNAKLVFLGRNERDKNIYLFAALTAVTFITSIISSIYIFVVMIQCSRELHNRMFGIVLKAPMYFFDTHPVGQILNRFSGDIHSMDDELPLAFSDLVKLGFLSIASVIVNCITVPYLTVFVVLVVIAFVYFRNYYITTAREVKRIEAVDRSPMFTHVASTLTGLSTIRSFGLQNTIYDEFIKCLDYQTESRMMFHRCSRWFAQRLDAGVVVFSFVCIAVPVAVAVHSDVDVGLIGVSFTYLLGLCGMFQWCVRQSAEVDNLMTSVERVREYSKLETEKDGPDSENFSSNWVKHGSISAENVSFAYYKTLPNVLTGINFNIKPMEKIGIVGRTGAGKSSLISMLFRLGKNSGKITIDEYDISKMTIKTLRKEISVIPQDPVLFTGTLRRNLDPFNEYSDESIWNALEEVKMKSSVMEFQGKLQAEISESGGNLSVGERQLLCLARALLKKNKILLVDEATANVDNKTDALIQKTIRSTFKECTVLTIAHRLNTVMDSDRIMVMNNGSIVEFDSPRILLNIEEGYFRRLVDETGKEQSKNLKHMIN